MKIKSLAMASVLALASVGAFAADTPFIAHGTGWTVDFGNDTSTPFACHGNQFCQDITFSNLPAATWSISGELIGTNLSFVSATLTSTNGSYQPASFVVGLVPGTTSFSFGVLNLTQLPPTLTLHIEANPEIGRAHV